MVFQDEANTGGRRRIFESNGGGAGGGKRKHKATRNARQRSHGSLYRRKERAFRRERVWRPGWPPESEAHRRVSHARGLDGGVRRHCRRPAPIARDSVLTTPLPLSPTWRGTRECA